MTIDELITELEKFGSSRESDCEIAMLVHGGEVVWKPANFTMKLHPVRRFASAAHVGGWAQEPVPFYTTSVDAALSLLPKGWRIDQVGEWDHERLRKLGPWVCILKPADREDLDIRARLDISFGSRCQHAATMELAIIIANLKVRKLIEEGKL